MTSPLPFVHSRCIAQWKLLLPFFAVLLIGWPAAQAQTQTSSPLQSEAKLRCSALVGWKFSEVQDAATQVLTATLVPANAELPEYCQIEAYIAPQVQFILQLPSQNWNGKLLVLGCGGFCGTLKMTFPGTKYDIEALDLQSARNALSRGYAVTGSNMGHVSTGRDGKWAYNNLQAKVDFAYRATHVNTLAAKAIVADFYGKSERHSYFQGCSTGGRQAMVEAQRFPEDFDGIIGGAGPLYYGTSGFQLYWSAIANLDKNKQPILRERDVRLLHEAVIKACDAIDGLKDGIIEDPRNCKFDPMFLQCKGNSRESCLSEAQIAAAKKIYQGPHDSKGKAIHVSGATLGSELNWLGQYVDSDTASAIFIDWPEDKFRYLTFLDDPGPRWNLGDLDWDKDPARARAIGFLYSGTNPDLRAFKQRGGKLLTFQGWEDQQVVPANYVDYYETVTRTMGGADETQDFFRLFMLPGVGHCYGGPGADVVDYLTYLEDWVERGQAPDALMAKHYDKHQLTFSRPVYPFPDVARYSGHGDVNDAANWIRKPIKAAK